MAIWRFEMFLRVLKNKQTTKQNSRMSCSLYSWNIFQHLRATPRGHAEIFIGGLVTKVFPARSLRVLHLKSVLSKIVKSLYCPGLR